MVRTIVPFDAEGHKALLSDIWFRASMIAHPFIGEGALIEQRPVMEDVYLPLATTYVACESGVPAGFVCMLEDHVAALFVDPDRQGQGIGCALLDHVRADRMALSLEVYIANRRAMDFYTARGFVIEARRGADEQEQPFANARMVWRKVYQ